MIEVEGGQKFRVLLGTTPEEVEKWRADRRKQFPTVEHTLEKEKQRSELRLAGGLAPLERGKKRPRQNVSASDEDKDRPERDNSKEDDGKPRRRPCAFFVRGTCKEGDNCTYSHDFEVKVCNFFIRNGRCQKGNRCTFSHDKEQRAAFLEEKKSSSATSKDKEEGGGDKDDGDKKKRQKGPQKEAKQLNDDEMRAAAQKKRGQLYLPKPFSGGARGTLLKKLLEHEVEEEENIILQCLRLILNNNYLQPKPMNPSIEVLGAEGEDGDVNDDYAAESDYSHKEVDIEDGEDVDLNDEIQIADRTRPGAVDVI